MKNIVILALAVTTLVGFYISAKSHFRLKLEGLEGKTETVIRGNLTLPINATGTIRPSQRIEIKAEASGEVIEIARHPGDRIRKGDLLIRLQPDDEQRSVDRAQRELDVAQARLAQSRVTLRQAKTADIQSAEARVKQLQEAVRLAKFRKDKLAKLPANQRSEEEVIQRDTTYLSQVAQLSEAQAALDRAKLSVRGVEQSVKQAEATVESAKTTLGDSLKRLSKTDIFSPIDGIVADVFVQIGEVIQGGKTTFTGGTVLARVLDADRLVVRAEVDESDIGRVLAIAPGWAKPGHDDTQIEPDDFEKVVSTMEHVPTITVESFRDQEFTGVIERIFPEPRDIQNVVTYLVDVVITSANRDVLLPGMRADVRFTAEHVTDAVLCPNGAIREGPNGRLGVYIPKPDSLPNDKETEFVPIKIGLDNGAYSEIQNGLAEGAIVYTKLPVQRDKDRDSKKRRRS